VCVHLDATAANWIKQAAEKYHDLQPQVADLSLLYLAQLLNIEHVFTLDRRDFSVYQNATQPGLILLPADFGSWQFVPSNIIEYRQNIFPRANGPRYPSLGQRPRFIRSAHTEGLKA